MCKRIECFYDELAEYLPGKSTSIMVSKDYDLKSLACIMNSKLMNFFYQVCYNSASLSGGFYTITHAQLEKMPIVELSNENKEIFNEYYDLYVKDVENISLLEKINEKVYEVYSIKDKEKEIIEEYIQNYYL